MFAKSFSRQTRTQKITRSYLALATLAAGFIGTTFALTAQSEARDYVMTCRAGGQMQAVAGQRVSTREAFVHIKFKPGTAGAAVRAPRAGECTWIDRGFRAGEPTKLVYKENGSWIQSVCSLNGCTTRSNSRSMLTLINAVKSGRPFQVHAHNDRQGNMIVTRVGP